MLVRRFFTDVPFSCGPDGADDARPLCRAGADSASHAEIRSEPPDQAKLDQFVANATRPVVAASGGAVAQRRRTTKRGLAESTSSWPRIRHQAATSGPAAGSSASSSTSSPTATSAIRRPSSMIGCGHFWPGSPASGAGAITARPAGSGSRRRSAAAPPRNARRRAGPVVRVRPIRTLPWVSAPIAARTWDGCSLLALQADPLATAKPGPVQLEGQRLAVDVERGEGQQVRDPAYRVAGDLDVGHPGARSRRAAAPPGGAAARPRRGRGAARCPARRRRRGSRHVRRSRPAPVLVVVGGVGGPPPGAPADHQEADPDRAAEGPGPPEQDRPPRHRLRSSRVEGAGGVEDERHPGLLRDWRWPRRTAGCVPTSWLATWRRRGGHPRVRRPRPSTGRGRPGPGGRPRPRGGRRGPGRRQHGGVVDRRGHDDVADPPPAAGPGRRRRRGRTGPATG